MRNGGGRLLLGLDRVFPVSHNDGSFCCQSKKKKWEPPAPPPRVGRKQRKRNAAATLGGKLPTITPNAKCKLRLLKLERVKDWLILEEEFVTNQERLKPQEERIEEDRTQVGPLVQEGYMRNFHFGSSLKNPRASAGGRASRHAHEHGHS